MEKVSGTKSFFFRFYILCEDFSKIGPIIKKIPKFQFDPLKVANTKYSKKHVLNNGFSSNNLGTQSLLKFSAVIYLNRIKNIVLT